MSDYTAISDVGKTLIKLLWDNIKDDDTAKSIIGSENQITLSSPEESDKKLSLFLYQVTENAYLKNEEMQSLNTKKLKYQPLFLNLFYLVTPHTKNSDNDPIILGKVMQIFHDNSILRGSVLHENLMARPLRIEFADALYHITSRGNERHDIFFTNDDWVTFLETLEQVCDRFNWLCHAYCLMTNHYHLLIETLDGNLSKGMRQINGVYTQ